MAVRTPMQTAMDRNGNGWHKMKILCCVLLFLFCCFCFRCLWCSHPAVVFAHWHKLTQINSEEHPPNVSLGFSCYQERVWKSSSTAWRYEKTTKQRTAMVTCKVRTPMQDGGINVRCEHRCKMAVRTPMQTAMDRNGNGWHDMKIMCCVCCFCFVVSVFAAFMLAPSSCVSVLLLLFLLLLVFAPCNCVRSLPRSLARSLCFSLAQCPSSEDYTYRATCTQQLLVNVQEFKRKRAADVIFTDDVHDGNHHVV